MADKKNEGAGISENMDTTVRFRLTSDEKERLGEAAKAAGMSLSAYIRSSLLEGFERPVSVPKRGEARARHIYLTDSDWAALKHNAMQAGFTANDFIRDQCVGKDPKFSGMDPAACIPGPDDMDDVRTLLTELKRQGNNWNQISLQLNSAKDKNQEIDLLHDQMRQMIRESRSTIYAIDDLFMVSEGKYPR